MAYNEEARIAGVLESILAQSFGEFALLIHDNKSTDSTLDVCRDFALRDTRVSINEGAFNVGALINGYRTRCGYRAKYISIRSSNDLMHPDYYAKAIALLEQDPLVGLAYSHGSEFSDDITTAVPAPDGFKIDTRNMDGLNSALEVMQRYTSPFSLWGVCRRNILEMCRPYQFSHGGDHIFIAEMSLYGAVAPVDGRLDFRYVPKADARGAIAANADSQLEEHVRGIAKTSLFYGVKQHMPFTDLIWGHIEMFSLARVDDVLKSNLIVMGVEMLKARFSPFLTDEAARFVVGINQILDGFKDVLIRQNPNLFMWLQKIKKELDKIKFLDTYPLVGLVELESRVSQLMNG